jgi:hypothetical protein
MRKVFMKGRNATGLVLLALVSGALLAREPDQVENTANAQVNIVVASPAQPVSPAPTYETVPELIEEQGSTLVRDLPSPDEGLAEYPAWNGYDLDCRDVGYPVSVPGADPHRLDADNDGVGCESQD